MIGWKVQRPVNIWRSRVNELSKEKRDSLLANIV